MSNPFDWVVDRFEREFGCAGVKAECRPLAGEVWLTPVPAGSHPGHGGIGGNADGGADRVGPGFVHYHQTGELGLITGLRRYSLDPAVPRPLRGLLCREQRANLTTGLLRQMHVNRTRERTPHV